MRLRQSPSPNHDARPAGTPVDILLLHYTDMRSCEEAVERLHRHDQELAMWCLFQ